MLLSIEYLEKSYGALSVLNGIKLDLPAGDTLAVLGRSGCGKTTLLKIIAGLSAPDAGIIRLRGKDITSLPPQQRGIVYLYQEPLLFPHLSVFDNVAFGLRLRKIREAEVLQKTQTMLEALELAALAHRKPEALSGGQKQRVSFGRALLVEPAVLLLDEPFGNLDADTRGAMQALFRQRVQDANMATVFVTHDVKEALLVGKRYGYMAQGRLDVFGTAQNFAADPRTGVQREKDFWKNFDQPDV